MAANLDDKEWPVIADILAIEAEAAQGAEKGVDDVWHYCDFDSPHHLATQGAAPEPTEDEIREYRLDADDPENARLNRLEWLAHKDVDAVADAFRKMAKVGPGFDARLDSGDLGTTPLIRPSDLAAEFVEAAQGVAPPDDRAEGDIAAYAKWRRDPSHVTADDLASEGAAPRAEGPTPEALAENTQRQLDAVDEALDWQSGWYKALDPSLPFGVGRVECIETMRAALATPRASSDGRIHGEAQCAWGAPCNCPPASEGAAPRAEELERDRILEALRDEQQYAGALSDALLRIGHHPFGHHESPTSYDADSPRACSFTQCLSRLSRSSNNPEETDGR